MRSLNSYLDLERAKFSRLNAILNVHPKFTLLHVVNAKYNMWVLTYSVQFNHESRSSETSEFDFGFVPKSLRYCFVVSVVMDLSFVKTLYERMTQCKQIFFMCSLNVS